jgi:hypothetical protein
MGWIDETKLGKITSGQSGVSVAVCQSAHLGLFKNLKIL